MLTGQFTRTLDQENRVAIPAKYREALGDTFMLCTAPNGENCLFAYSMPAWNGLMEYLKNQSPSLALTMRQRLLFMNAVDVTPEKKQGRIKIPPELLEKAKLTQEVRLIGAGERMELWSPEELERMLQRADAMEEELLVNLPY